MSCSLTCKMFKEYQHNGNLFCRISNNDCLLEYENIPRGSIDLILVDPPYGIMKGMLDTENKQVKKYEWDEAIKPQDIYNIAGYTLRENGRMALFSMQPYTTQLLRTLNKGIYFNRMLYWNKLHFSNPYAVKTAHTSIIEEILLFNKKHDRQSNKELREYALKVFAYINKPMKEITAILGNMGARHFLEDALPHRLQFSLPSEKTYNKLIEIFHIDKMDGFLTYKEMKKKIKKYLKTFNLGDKNHKSNLLTYKKDSYSKSFHPTQKPVALLEDLIETFTNEGDTVLDFTAGSFSTAIACINTKRNFYGIEKDSNYFSIAEKRIKDRLETVGEMNDCGLI